MGLDSDSQSPMLVTVADEGLYGFRFVFHSAYGRPTPPPQSGDSPDLWIAVDVTEPRARILSVDQSVDRPRQVTIRWQASDRQLAAAPISLYYGDRAAGRWAPIAKDLANSGRFDWTIPSGVPDQADFRLEVRDSAGNLSVAETPRAIPLAPPLRARRTERAPSQVQIRGVRAVGQSAQASPRRYYFR